MDARPPIVNGFPVHSHVGEWCPMCLDRGRLLAAPAVTETDLRALLDLSERGKHFELRSRLRAALATPPAEPPNERDDDGR